MAAPITAIQKMTPSEEEKAEQKIDSLKRLCSENEEALTEIIKIIKELHDTNLLEAANAMLKEKEDIAKIVLNQVNREPVTNLISILTGATGALSKLDSEQTVKLISSFTAGLTEANRYIENSEKIRIFDLIRLLNDPDINRVIGFLIHLLKGMGKDLNRQDHI